MRPIIGITMGDAAGIGPEVVLKALARASIYRVCRPLAIGDLTIFQRMLECLPDLSSRLHLQQVKNVGETRFRHGTVEILQGTEEDLSRVVLGTVSSVAGAAAVHCLQRAAALAMRGEISAIATAPLNKEAMNQAGFHYPGHTELLAAITNTTDYGMMLVAGALRVLHVTTHVALRRACDLVTRERVLDTIRLAHKTARDLGVATPTVAVAGLNPHASERGLFGHEEAEAIEPAVAQARAEGIQAIGPVSPDTVFLRARKGEFDIVVAMYHDQGHIPVKLLGFATGVNATVGLPIIRTSVDHGTGFDIAGKGVADPTSMVEAIKLATVMAKARLAAKREPVA